MGSKKVRLCVEDFIGSFNKQMQIMFSIYLAVNNKNNSFQGYINNKHTSHKNNKDII